MTLERWRIVFLLLVEVRISCLSDAGRDISQSVHHEHDLVGANVEVEGVPHLLSRHTGHVTRLVCLHIRVCAWWDLHGREALFWRTVVRSAGRADEDHVEEGEAAEGIHYVMVYEEFLRVDVLNITEQEMQRLDWKRLSGLKAAFGFETVHITRARRDSEEVVVDLPCSVY